jgi:hypothetical protein
MEKNTIIGTTYQFHDRFNNTISGTITFINPSIIIKGEDGETYPAYISITTSWKKYYSLHFEKDGELFTTRLPKDTVIYCIDYQSEISDYETRTVHSSKHYYRFYFSEDAAKKDYDIMTRNYELIANSRHNGHKITYDEYEKPYTDGARAMEFSDDNKLNKRETIKIQFYSDEYHF